MIAVLWMLVLLLVCLFIGYTVGRRQGMRWGRKLGEAETCIRLRQESLSAGRCKICDQTYE
ncbi:hypothetical protein [Effusibacillus pohliae]|uniref:hypothetical protein n=1 Tax=Effusibacillus pohliae TaxID=232270 RepID=UPI00037EE1BC|nr:hypothetical protein [Effusibacillus pohliae]